MTTEPPDPEVLALAVERYDAALANLELVEAELVEVRGPGGFDGAALFLAGGLLLWAPT